LLEISDVRYLYTFFGQGANRDVTEICIQTSDKTDRPWRRDGSKRLRKPSGHELEQLMPQ
jgi:hypothetical protein